MFRRVESGFSLLESIVALVILSVVFATVWGWFGTAVITTERVQDAIARPEAVKEFLRRMELVDLQQQEQGEIYVGDAQFQWQASIQRQSDQERFRRQPEWIIALYKVDVRVVSDGKALNEFETLFVRQWRDPNYIDFSQGLIQ